MIMKDFFLFNFKLSNYDCLKGPERIYSNRKCLNGNIICGIDDEDRSSSLVFYQFKNRNFEKIKKEEIIIMIVNYLSMN